MPHHRPATEKIATNPHETTPPAHKTTPRARKTTPHARATTTCEKVQTKRDNVRVLIKKRDTNDKRFLPHATTSARQVKKKTPSAKKPACVATKSAAKGKTTPEIRHGRDLFTIRMLPSPSRLGPGREATARFCRGGESVRHPPRAHLAEHSSLTTTGTFLAQAPFTRRRKERPSCQASSLSPSAPRRRSGFSRPRHTLCLCAMSLLWHASWEGVGSPHDEITGA